MPILKILFTVLFIFSVYLPANEEYNRGMSHFFYTHANHLYSQKNYFQAVKYYSAAVKLTPKHAWVLHRQGNCYLMMKNYQKAIICYKKAIEQDNPPLFSYYNLGCIYSLQKDKKNALLFLEKTLQKGYKKWDKLKADADWNYIKAEPKYQELVKKAKKAEKQLSLVQKYQNSAYEGKMKILEKSLSEKHPKQLAIAILAFNESYRGYRIGSISLFHSVATDEAKKYLTIALFDANGYVKKAAANALISYGLSIEERIAAILNQSSSPATPYAIQILGHIGSKKSIDLLIPFLKEEDRFIQITTADSLARLKAISAITALEQALKGIKEEFYQVKIQMVISYLKSLKNKMNSKKSKSK